MKSDDIRRKFLEFFERNGHEIRPSSPLVPKDDPTLMFANAGMVQFKRVFLGEESLGTRRATTSQKCLRVSGKHNDLEEVGRTARHHTFFEMLGNFSFGDYFKREAIDFAWRLFTEEYGLPEERLWATVHHSDDEAFALWQEVTGLPGSRIFRLGDKDNCWQMGDTGPCGPCSEIHFDMRPEGERGTDLDAAAFEARGEAGEFLELWNLVFMQYNRDADGELHALPEPSIDTGAGLERIASVLQGKDTNYETDLFLPLIERVARVVGRPYDRDSEEGFSYRVLADHARATAFLLADGVFPSNAERGYVLRRIMRRGIRHAWLLGRREPTLVEVVDQVVDRMGGAYPELRERREHLLRATRAEEERFLATIDEGMTRFDKIAPPSTGKTVKLPVAKAKATAGTMVISGEDVFRLYDTYGFPLDLTQLMAEERGYGVDLEGFEAALAEQRRRSRADRDAAGIAHGDELAHGWTTLGEEEQEFVGYAATDVETEVLAFRRQNGRAALQLRENPFYVEAGGQISDSGEVLGDGWRMAVEDVRRVGGRAAVIGDVEGDFPDSDAPFPATARVAGRTRRDTERNHTATHLLHAALRKVLGTHVLQRGSLVAPDRLRFDFSHPSPMTAEETRRVEEEVNAAILEDQDVCVDFLGYDEAIRKGAMALFGEKYGDVVRMISVPGVSMELCGGTHVRHTGEIGLFRIVGETGTGAGVRRIEAVTGREAYRMTVRQDRLLREAAEALRTPPDMLLRRIEQLQADNRELERQLERARSQGASDVVGRLVDGAMTVDGARIVAEEVEVADQAELRTLGDQLRDRLGSGVVVLAARSDDRMALFAVVTDDLIGRGVRADRVIRRIAELTGGSGGGRPHMAQGGVGDPARVADALRHAPEIVRDLLGEGA
ncbi:MAG TPA: alanine--tRNA ligase [Longimicrobiales bacterium]|nr:alanine--tRNA ligase [Longimicrobiales bacterium]